MTEEEQRFILDNIESLNDGVTEFFRTNDNINKEEALSFLSLKLQNDIKDSSIRDALYAELVRHNFVKTRIKTIANDNNYYKEHLAKFLRQIVLQKFFNIHKNDVPELTDLVLEELKSRADNENEFRFLKADYKKVLEKFLYMFLKGGFSENLTNVNFGIMVANAGDAAEFLFVGRAMLAGYNCSSVDVRSSRYDAIIDINGTLLRVQVKGISNNNISFKDRDRGGQGIDYSHERNRGQRITSQDCDIYVAVDKQVGVLYIIPMYFVDNLDDNDLSKSTSDLEEYKENWEIIKNVSERLKILQIR